MTTESIVIRLPSDAKSKYAELAKENGIPLATQLRMELVQKLKRK